MSGLGFQGSRLDIEAVIGEVSQGVLQESTSMGGRIKIQNWVKRKSELYCSTRKSSASPAVTSGPEMTLDQTLDSGPELSGFGFGACVFRLLCQKLTGYRLFLEWGLTLGQALFSSVKLSERGYKPRTASQKTFQHLGQKFFSPDGDLGGKKQHLQQKCAACFKFRHVID